ncbi:MAG TPA: hypothetical protein VLG40_03355 [Candidatus Saccharimonas sp.]|nr:hypothetical protein [Candidatus Saccharimonas sp.]
MGAKTTKVPVDLAALGLQVLIEQIDTDLAAMPDAPNRSELLQLRETAVAELARVSQKMSAPVQASSVQAVLNPDNTPSVAQVMHALARFRGAVCASIKASRGRWPKLQGEDAFRRLVDSSQSNDGTVDNAVLRELLLQIIAAVKSSSTHDQLTMLCELDWLSHEIKLHPHLAKSFAHARTYGDLLLLLEVSAIIDRIT